MKKIQWSYMLLFLMLMGTFVSAQAQFAGPDKWVARTNGSVDVVLGLPDDNPYVCYQWMGNNIIGDNQKSQIHVSPTDTVTVYWVKRISANGVEDDQVVVTLVDEVLIDSVSPRHQCWTKGSAVDIADFMAVTKPAGMEQSVRIARGSTVAKASALFAESDTVITIEAYVNGRVTDRKSCPIHVVNHEILLGKGSNTSLDLLKNIGRDCQTQLALIKSKLGLLKGSKAVSEPVQQVKIDGNKYKYCGCPDEKNSRQVVNRNVASVDLKSAVTYQSEALVLTQFPLLNIGTQLAMNLDVNYSDTLKLDECDSTTCVDVNAQLKITPAVEVRELTKMALQGSASAETVVNSSPSRFCMDKGQMDWGPVQVEIKGQVAVKMLSMTQANYKIILLDDKMINGDEK